MKWLLIPLVAYLALVALVYAAQRSLLYLPGHREASAAGLETAGLVPWPDEKAHRGYLFEPPAARTATAATVVVFHGNAGQALDRTYYLDALGDGRTRVLLAEYPGYGTRPGRPSEETLATDARETLRLARQRFPEGPLHVVGESLGAAVAAAAIGSDAVPGPKPKVDALALLTPWDRLAAVASHHYRFLPVRWLLKDRYSSERHLAGFRAPKAVVLAERDEIVPARFGRALFEALAAPKTLLVVDGAGHNDWFGRVDARWWRALRAALDGSGGDGPEG